MINIRPFEPQDACGVASLILPIQQQEFGLQINLESQADLQTIPSFYQHGCGNFWVAQAAGTIVGSIALLDIGNRQAALRKMFVASDYRGSAYGVAVSLLKTLTQWARSKNVEAIFLGTTDRFLAAHRFYEKNGFKEIAESDLPSAFPIMKVDSKFYVFSTQ
jgi:N-acetylglutamate synthase-like GNAT family acetyltransferase